MMHRSRQQPLMSPIFRFEVGGNERSILLASDKRIVNEVEVRTNHPGWQATEQAGKRTFTFSSSSISGIGIVVESSADGQVDVTFTDPENRGGRKFSDMIREAKRLPPSAQVSCMLAEDLYNFLDRRFSQPSSPASEDLPNL